MLDACKGDINKNATQVVPMRVSATVARGAGQFDVPPAGGAGLFGDEGAFFRFRPLFGLTDPTLVRGGSRFGPGPALRALRTAKTTEYEKAPPENIMGEFGRALDLYFGGDMEASIALSGQVAGRIDSVKPVAQVISETVREFEEIMTEMGARYGVREPA